jgi:transcription initiation factor TFIIB
MAIKKIKQNQNGDGLTLLICDHDKKDRITDEERGEIICSPCGQVLTEGIARSDSRPTHSLDGFLRNSQTGPKSSLTVYDKGLNTNIGAKNVDFAGKKMSSNTISRFKSMRVWDSRSKSKASGRNLISALVLLDGVKQKLGLSSAITEHVAFIYRKASSLGLIRGRGTSEVMAASVYAACRENGIPWSLDEIANTLNIPKKRLAKCYMVLVESLDIKPELANPLDCLSKFCSALGVKEKTKRCAFNILKQANSKRILSGSKPAVVCAGALHLACIVNGENISQIKIAEKTKVSLPSIRKALSALNKALSVV